MAEFGFKQVLGASTGDECCELKECKRHDWGDLPSSIAKGTRSIMESRHKR
jgi:hypothetical protein